MRATPKSVFITEAAAVNSNNNPDTKTQDKPSRTLDEDIKPTSTQPTNLFGKKETKETSTNSVPSSSLGNEHQGLLSFI